MRRSFKLSKVINIKIKLIRKKTVVINNLRLASSINNKEIL